MKKLLFILLLFTGIINAQNMNGTSWYSSAVDSGDTVTAAIDLEGKNLKPVMVAVDTPWIAGTNLVAMVYDGETKEYHPYTSDGLLVEVEIGTIVTPTKIALAPYLWAGVEKMKWKFWSAAGDTAVVIDSTGMYIPAGATGTDSVWTQNVYTGWRPY